jgi:hypothetical protein
MGVEALRGLRSSQWNLENIRDSGDQRNLNPDFAKHVNMVRAVIVGPEGNLLYFHTQKSQQEGQKNWIMERKLDGKGSLTDAPPTAYTEAGVFCGEREKDLVLK